MTLYWLEGSFWVRSLMRFPWFYLFCALGVFFSSIIQVEAQILSVTFGDRSKDHLGPIDLTRLTLTFDQSTGEYEVILEADHGAKFQGGFLVGINLFNGDLGTTALDPSFFHAEAEVFALDCPAMRYRLAGFDSRLMDWSIGDRIAASGPAPLGLPAGFAFFSSGLASSEDSVQGTDLVGEGVVGTLHEASGFAIYEVSPTAVDDAFEVLEDSPTQAFDVLRNDCGQAGTGPLEITQVEEESIRGELELIDGLLFYTPPKDFYGIETFSYEVFDANGNTDRGMASISVVSVNDPPIGREDVIEINLRESRYVLDVLENDSTEPDFDEVLSLEDVEYDPSLGGIVIEGNYLVLEADERFRGEATFKYFISDGNGGRAEAAVRISLEQANVDPTAVDDYVLGFEDSVLVIDVLANDTSAPDDGEVLSVSVLGESHANAKVVLRDGKVLYEAPPNFYGNDLFTYQIEDGFGGSSQASVHLTIANTGDPPLANDDSVAFIADGTPYFLEPLLNDRSEPDPSESLELSELHYSGDAASVSIEGSLIRIDPVQGFVGSFEFDYVIEDESGEAAIGKVSVAVLDSNFPPIAYSDSVRIDSVDEVATIDVLANDTSEPDEGENLTISSTIGIGLQGGRLSHDGRLVYFEPDEGFESGWFRYTIVDDKGAQDSAVVVVTSALLKEMPVANDDFFVVREDEDAVLDVVGNDDVSPSYKETLVLSISIGPTNGEADFNGQGMIVYRPEKDFYGRDSIQYQITYPTGTSDFGELLIEVQNTNDPPSAINDAFSVLEDSGRNRLDVLGNDSGLPDPDERVTLLAVNGSQHGAILSIDGDTLVYEPAQNFFGTDSLVYSVRDEGGLMAFGRIEVTVAAVNDPPLALPDTVGVDSRSNRVLIDVLANDSSLPDRDEDLRVFSVTQGESGGRVTLEGGQIFYSPPKAWVTRDQFEYSVSDGNGGTDKASVAVNIENSIPEHRGIEDKFEIKEDGASVILDVLANDSLRGVENLSEIKLSVERAEGGGHVTARGQELFLTPDADFFGVINFSYYIQYEDWRSASTLVTVTVIPVNDPPLVVDDVFLIENPSHDIFLDVLANDSIGGDFDEQLSIVSIDGLTEGVRLILRDEGLYVAVDPDFVGDVVFSYKVSDGNGGEGAATVHLEVTRQDVFPPVLVCRDFEIVLPASGFVELDASDIDGGSFDKEGQLSISISPNRFDASNIGPNQVELRGVDEAGNESICEALLTILPARDLAVQLVNPEPRSVYRVMEHYGFSAADIPIEISYSDAVESIEIYGDGERLMTLSTLPSGANIEWQWEQVAWGDHELRIVGIGERGASIDPLSVQLSVNDLASKVALVVPERFRSGALELLQNYLFELGVNVDVFLDVLESGFVETEWDMVIQYGASHGDINEASISIFETLASRGVGLYFIGNSLLEASDLSDDLKVRWVRLVLFDRQAPRPLEGLVDSFIDPGEASLEGRFGQVQPFQTFGFSSGKLVDPFADSLIQKDGADLAALVDRSFIPPLGIVGRRFVQLFPVENDASQSDLKTLFQNATCWVLPECFECENASISPHFVEAGPYPVIGETFSVELSLANNGECEITGAVASVVGEGLELVSLRVDGREVDISQSANGEISSGLIGRIGKGSDAAVLLEWELRTSNPDLRMIEFETRSNNTKSDFVSLALQIASATISLDSEGSPRLVIQADEAGVYDVEYAEDLDEPVRWQTFQRSMSVGADGHAEFELNSHKSAQFYRVRSRNSLD